MWLIGDMQANANGKWHRAAAVIWMSSEIWTPRPPMRVGGTAGAAAPMPKQRAEAPQVREAGQCGRSAMRSANKRKTLPADGLDISCNLDLPSRMRSHDTGKRRLVLELGMRLYNRIQAQCVHAER